MAKPTIRRSATWKVTISCDDHCKCNKCGSEICRGEKVVKYKTREDNIGFICKQCAEVAAR